MARSKWEVTYTKSGAQYRHVETIRGDADGLQCWDETAASRAWTLIKVQRNGTTLWDADNPTVPSAIADKVRKRVQLAQANKRRTVNDNYSVAVAQLKERTARLADTRAELLDSETELTKITAERDKLSRQLGEMANELGAARQGSSSWTEIHEKLEVSRQASTDVGEESDCLVYGANDASFELGVLRLRGRGIKVIAGRGLVLEQLKKG